MEKPHKQSMLKSFLEMQFIIWLLKLTAKMRLGRVLLFIIVMCQTKKKLWGKAPGLLSSVLGVLSIEFSLPNSLLLKGSWAIQNTVFNLYNSFEVVRGQWGKFMA